MEQRLRESIVVRDDKTYRLFDVILAETSHADWGTMLKEQCHPQLQVRHPSVLTLKEIVPSDTRIHFLFEYFNSKTLPSLTKKPFSEPIALYIVREILLAMTTHEFPYLRMECVWVTENGEIKLGGLMAFDLYQSKVSKFDVLTPELADGSTPPDQSATIVFLVGSLLYELLTGEKLLRKLKDTSELRTLQRIRGFQYETNVSPVTISPRAQGYLNALLAPLSARPATAEKALKLLEQTFPDLDPHAASTALSQLFKQADQQQNK